MIAITGADGFIGKHLSQYLLKKGIETRRITREGNDNTFAIGNISRKTNWYKALNNIEVLIHCASITSIDNQNSSTIAKLNEVNIKATKNMIEHAAKIGVKRIIFISSAKVNGDITPKNLKFNNESKPNPKDLYSLSKYKAENLLKSISNKNNIELVIIRPTLVYGEFVKGNFLSLINLVNKGIPLPLKNIKNSRSILYVGNLTYFIYMCIFKSDAKGKTFLISDLNPISTPDLIILLSEKLRKKTILFFFPIYLMRIFCSIFKKKKALSSLIDSFQIDPKDSYLFMNSKPPFSTEEGIIKTIDWFNRKNN